MKIMRKCLGVIGSLVICVMMLGNTANAMDYDAKYGIISFTRYDAQIGLDYAFVCVEEWIDNPGSTFLNCNYELHSDGRIIDANTGKRVTWEKMIQSFYGTNPDNVCISPAEWLKKGNYKNVEELYNDIAQNGNKIATKNNSNEKKNTAKIDNTSYADAVNLANYYSKLVETNKLKKDSAEAQLAAYYKALAKQLK